MCPSKSASESDHDQNADAASDSSRWKPEWPTPTTPVPDLETLEAWLWEDGGAEATDGCWVECDGRCPHNHPSWLLRLGMV